MLHLQFDVPKGQSQISPGQRPGNTFTSQTRALTGRNRIRFSRATATSQRPRIRASLQGMRFLGIAVPGGLPWAGMSLPLRGGISNRATSKRASEGIGVVHSGGAGFIPTRRASEGIGGFRSAGSGSIPTRRCPDVAPPGLRPEGAVTNQPRATPWEHVHQPNPSPDGAKQNSVFPGDRDVATAENCGALTGHAVPWNRGSQGVALGWHVASPSGRNFESRNIKTRQRGDWRCPFRRRGFHTNPTRQRTDWRFPLGRFRFHTNSTRQF